jgi:tRNA-specific 2-thiouridylase
LIDKQGKVVMAMSGGVDSSVAACLLHEQGYEVVGLFMCAGIVPPGDAGAAVGHRGCCSAEDASDAKRVAGKLGIGFFTLDFKNQFDTIIDYFTEEYRRGRTPNPCIICNQDLKFGRLAEHSRVVGADFVATGHYARIEKLDGEYRLCRAVDHSKDQTYVLFSIQREMLGRTLFPLGGMTKDEVRRYADGLGLEVSEKPESQDICFAPDRDYARIVRERCPEAFVKGPIVDVEGNEVGRHEGIPNFTIGQRRGTGVAMGQPVYVSHIDAASNTIVVGTREQLVSDNLSASKINWLVDKPQTSFRAEVKIRYAHQAAPAVVELVGDDGVRVQFDEPQFAVTPGQAAVFYDGDTVVGGGWIDAVEH